VTMLIGFVIMAGVPAYFVAQPVALFRWPGSWRRAALAPLALTEPASFFSLYALYQHSNLWPLTLIFATAIGMVYLSALWLARWWL
jgi:hypothetical protein